MSGPTPVGDLKVFFASLQPVISAIWNNKPYAVVVVAAATIAYYHFGLHQNVPLDVWGAELAVLGGAVHSSVKNS